MERETEREKKNKKKSKSTHTHTKGKQDRASVIRTSGVRQEASTPKSKDAPGGEGRMGMTLSWEALCTTWALRIPEAVPPGGLRAWLPRSGVTLHYSCAV